MIYLASPYSSLDIKVMRERYYTTRHCVANMLRERHWVYSPIVHCHELAEHHTMPRDAGFWWDYDRHMLIRATSLWVLALPGWDTSRGVRQEMEFWRTMYPANDPLAMVDHEESLVIVDPEEWLK